MTLVDPRHRNHIFPATTAGDYVTQYAQSLAQVLADVDKNAVNTAYALLEQTLQRGGRVLAGGNGGSAAVTDHLVCDWMKSTRAPGQPVLRVQSLTAHTALATAICNDHGFDHIFSAQIDMTAQPGDVCVLISSSGNSANIVRALDAAEAKKLPVIGMTGFDGGVLHQRATVSLHIPVHNYGIVEDAHQALMHSLAQCLARAQDQRAAT